MKWFGGATIMLVLLWLFVYGYANRHAELRHVAQDVDKYRERLAELQEQVKGPEALKEEELRLNEIRKSLVSKEETLGAKYGEVQHLEARRDALLVECGKCANEISSGTQEVARIKKDVEKLQVESDFMRKTRERLAQERDSILLEIENAKKERERCDNLAVKAKSRYDALSQKAVDAEQKIAEYEVEGDRLKVEQGRLSANVAAAKKELGKLQSDIVDAESKRVALAAITARATTLNDEIKSKISEKEQLAREIRKLSEERDRLAAAVQKVNLDLGEAEKKRSARDIEKQVEQIESRMLDRIDELSKRISEVEKKGEGK